jgi:hypothetical protein
MPSPREVRLASVMWCAVGTLAALLISPSGAAAGGWDPSELFSVPQFLNFLCEQTSYFCNNNRQDKVRLVVLDYKDTSSVPSNSNDGWGQFEALGLDRNWTECVSSEHAGILLRSPMTVYDGHHLRLAFSMSDGNILRDWLFTADPDWARPGQDKSLGVSAMPQREIFFDFVSAMRYPAARDIKMSIKVQVDKDGVPYPGNEHNYQVALKQGRDQYMYSCGLGQFTPGQYELTFLISDDFYTPDPPITVDLNVLPTPDAGGASTSPTQ